MFFFLAFSRVWIKVEKRKREIKVAKKWEGGLKWADKKSDHKNESIKSDRWGEFSLTYTGKHIEREVRYIYMSKRDRERERTRDDDDGKTLIHAYTGV